MSNFIPRRESVFCSLDNLSYSVVGKHRNFEDGDKETEPDAESHLKGFVRSRSCVWSKRDRE